MVAPPDEQLGGSTSAYLYKVRQGCKKSPKKTPVAEGCNINTTNLVYVSQVFSKKIPKKGALGARWVFSFLSRALFPGRKTILY